MDVYSIITNRLVALLEKGTVPWHQPWGGEERVPKNLVSGKQYRGVNLLVLASAGYESPFWLTYRQAKEAGGGVRQGERGYPCIYWNWVKRENSETKSSKAFSVLRYYTIFNVLQCAGVEYPRVRGSPEPLEVTAACEKIVEGMPNRPNILYGGNRAAYNPHSDIINIPEKDTFDNSESYYSVLFHEVCHSTGHSSRLARPGITEPIIFGSPRYSKEELIAEMGAAFLCGHAGIDNKVVDNSAAYISSWLRKLQDDKRLVVHAAGQAQKAADYILNKNDKGGDGDEMLNMPEEAG